MKIPTVEQIQFCDNYTIENEPVSPIDLMERAAKTCVNKIKELFSPDASIAIFCGMGNNGGDGLAITRLLLDSEYVCNAFFVQHGENCSADCKENLERLQKKYPDNIHIIKNIENIPILIEYNLIVDSLFGSGLSKIIDSELLTQLIRKINSSFAFVFAVDMPSGLFADIHTPVNSTVVEADFTLSFQFPKVSFLFPENYTYVGEWAIADISLHPDSIREIQSNNNLITSNLVHKILRKREKYAHKGHFGHGLLIAGSKGMMGAAVLAAKSCLRSGIGLLTVHIPALGYNIMQTAVNEAMCVCDAEENYFSGVEFKSLSKYNAVAVGSGLEKNKASAYGLKKLIADFGGNIVFDADAINLLSENKTWLEFIPKNCIFTPHLKEFERLTRPAENLFERLKIQKEFSARHHCTVVLKGAHTCISSPQGDVYFNTTGNPGMATAGSGDVLTGIILSFLAQGYTANQAAVLGVYLHGKSADIVLNQQSMESLIASDIIENLGKAFNSIID
jgi:NAD(P)H-hydrate epimerase